MLTITDVPVNTNVTQFVNSAGASPNEPHPLSKAMDFSSVFNDLFSDHTPATSSLRDFTLGHRSCEGALFEKVDLFSRRPPTARILDMFGIFHAYIIIIVYFRLKVHRN